MNAHTPGPNCGCRFRYQCGCHITVRGRRFECPAHAAAPALLAALEQLLTAKRGELDWDAARAAIRAAKEETQ